MKFGLFGINMNVCSNPDIAARVAKAAEAAGFESVWTGEHVVLPDPQVPPSPLPPSYPLLDPAVSLAYIAAHTKTIRLRTGIIILPQRNPLVLAKELTSVDVVSNGRLIFGLGIGYLKPEFDALGIPFDKKGARSMDYLQAMKAVWTQDKPAHHGEFVSFSGIQALPQPVQKPHPPIYMAATTAESFPIAGSTGRHLFVGVRRNSIAGVKQSVSVYRQAWRDAGHAGQGDVTLRIPVYVGATHAQAIAEAVPRISRMAPLNAAVSTSIL